MQWDQTSQAFLSKNIAYADCASDSLYTTGDCGANIINQCVGDQCTSGIAKSELESALKDKVAT